MRSLLIEERDDLLLDFSMMFAITAASVGHVTVGLRRSEARLGVFFRVLLRSTD